MTDEHGFDAALLGVLAAAELLFTTATSGPVRVILALVGALPLWGAVISLCLHVRDRRR